MKLKYEVQDTKYQTIKSVLKLYFEISERLLIKLKQNQRIYLNNSISYVNQEVKIGDVIEIDLDFNESSDNIIPVKMNLNIVFEDDYLLVLNKPAGMPVHPSILHYKDSLSNGVKYYFDLNNINKKIRAVNRLDKDTSGIVIFAKHQYIQETLVKQMKSNTFVKKYIAILEGHLEKQSGTINAPISRKSNSIIEREINETGDFSVTHFELIKNFKLDNIKLSLVRFGLQTGRTHQIRVHSKHIGHPILGDSLYGKSSYLIGRQSLHSYKVSFTHPINKKTLNLFAELPDDMRNLLKNIDNTEIIC